MIFFWEYYCKGIRNGLSIPKVKSNRKQTTGRRRVKTKLYYFTHYSAHYSSEVLPEKAKLHVVLSQHTNFPAVSMQEMKLHIENDLISAIQ